MRATCKSCGATIIWVKTTKAENMPIDAEPRPDGNIYLEGGIAFYGESMFAKERYASHFAVCPDAASWRRRR